MADSILSDKDLAPSSQSLPGSAEPVLDSFRPLPFSFAKRHGVFLVKGIEGLNCFMREGASPSALLEVKRHYNHPFSLVKLDEDDFESQLSTFYQSGTGGAQQAMDDMGEEIDLFKFAEEFAETEDLLEAEDDAPIIKLINALLTEAIKENASDIHIETFEKTLSVRFRVDGVLRDVLQPSRKLAPLLVSRIKVMAKLDIAEKRVPQDGRIALRIANRAVDVRVSTMPSSHGERVVLRLLDKEAGRLEFSHLGMQDDTMELTSSLLHKPHGIILVTGPTGSGKTTTLYAGLSLLNNSTRNILTVEDPIEYLIDGIGQTQVNPKVEMTFARGLRAILRQDPDVVMVGEIRDLETAQIAVQASLTGHLVLSTLHTNTAVGAVTRMQDMGVEPFLLSSSILGVIAQRLVRRLCPECKKPSVASEKECELMGFDSQEPPTIYHPVGCEVCSYRGYQGRQGIYELVVVDDEMRTMIHNNSSEQEMERHARKATPSIRADGRARVLQGMTSVEEILRVTRED